MCYINGIRVSLATFLEYKKIQKELTAINAIVRNRQVQRGFDYSDWPVIKPGSDGKDWNIVAMEWGFLPNYLQTAHAVEKFRKGYTNAAGIFVTPFTTLNAVGEELLQHNKMFRQAALQHRCIILSSGFYEHRHVFDKNKRTGAPKKTPTKFPYYITVPGKEIFMMAGIYNTWTDKETGETRDTFAIVTTKANALMEQVHNSRMRMPVILNEEMADMWTEPDLSEAEILQIATYQFPAELMSAHPVSKSFLEDESPADQFVYPNLPDLSR